jgi:uncharacterized protein YlaI
MDCPNCHQPMTTQSMPASGALGRPADVDLCAPCNLIWFDRGEDLSLAGESVIALFRTIGAAGAARNPLVSTYTCPRCRHALALTHDIVRTGRFAYWRCPQGDGRLIAFGQFLAEKNLVRLPSAAELAKLRATVREVSCSQCGAPIDLATQSACSHCGAAVMLVDPAAIAAALRELEAPAQAATASASAATDAATHTALSDAQIDALFDAERMRDRERANERLDLVALGATAIGAALERLFAAR